MKNTTRHWTVLLAFLAAGACADTSDEAGAMEDGAPAAGEAEQTAEGMDMAAGDVHGNLPAGYALRLDREDADAAEYQVMTMGGGLHVQTGPAGILYDGTHTVESGDYGVSATFTEIGAPADHREAFGLFIGGSDLQGENQAYTYFLVRADGRYLIKRRSGAETSNVSEGGWVASDAVHAATGDGDITNELAIEIRGDQAHFRVNGTEVATFPVSEIDTHGIAGLRINHRLNVHIAGFQISS